MFGLGSMELVIISVIILLLFGSRLPSVMRSLGRGVVEFKKGVHGIEDDVEGSVNKESTQTKSEETVNHGS